MRLCMEPETSSSGSVEWRPLPDLPTLPQWQKLTLALLLPYLQSAFVLRLSYRFGCISEGKATDLIRSTRPALGNRM
jgi:hypothetical protein